MPSKPPEPDPTPPAGETPEPADRAPAAAEEVPPAGAASEGDDVLYRATLLGRYYNEQLLADGIREDDTDLSFTTILLGFLASKAPLSEWFRCYVRDANVLVEHILSSKRIDPRALEEIASEPFAPQVSSRYWTLSGYHIMQAAERLGKEVEGRDDDSYRQERYLMAAYIYRGTPEQEKKLAAWRFNLVNWSNAFLSYLKSGYMTDDEMEPWAELHRKKFGREPVIRRLLPREREGSPDVTPLHLDNPSEVDYLGRRGFAEALGIRLNRVWRECNRQEDADDVRSSFVLHLHGPWGSGKTSLLKFLRKELQPPRGAAAAGRWPLSLLRRWLQPFRESGGVEEDGGPAEAARWVVVEFNAWQHQRISPPWWPLLEVVYRRAVGQLADGELFAARWHAWRVRARERWWRFSTARKDYLLTMVVAFVVLGGLLYLLARPQPEGDEGFWTLAKSAGAILSAAVGVWSTVLLATRSLISGSSRSAQAFMEVAGDPMERISGHFRDLVGWVDKPVVIFVDDLDRCQSKYVVELLEGIQTLFSDPRVVYVIAADRRWLDTCFETAYKEFAGAVKEPGRRLGSLFLEKAFELSVAVPRLSKEMKEVYWDYLVHGARADLEQAIERESDDVRNDFVDAETEEQVFVRLRESTGDPLRDQVRKGAAVRRLASRRVVASTEYFLKPFAPLLEPNPRAMKRLVNAYSVLRDTALLAGADILVDIERRKQLVLWAIVSLRWPALEEYLEEHPGVVNSVRGGALRVDGRPLIPDRGLQKLIESEEVLRVFEGGGTGEGLHAEALCRIVGISAGEPPTRPVA